MCSVLLKTKLSDRPGNSGEKRSHREFKISRCYRRWMIYKCHELTCLDGLPIKPRDRACIHAWKEVRSFLQNLSECLSCTFLGGAPTSIFDFFRSLRSPRLLRLPRLPRLSQISDCQKTRLYEHISRGSSI